MSAEWKNGCGGCFNNCGMCIVTWLVPCYTVGKVAESVGENCILCGLLTLLPLVGNVSRTMVRGKVRETKGIGGGLVGDFCIHLFCPVCAVMQEYQEMYPPAGSGGQVISRQ